DAGGASLSVPAYAQPTVASRARMVTASVTGPVHQSPRNAQVTRLRSEHVSSMSQDYGRTTVADRTSAFIINKNAAPSPPLIKQLQKRGLLSFCSLWIPNAHQYL